MSLLNDLPRLVQEAEPAALPSIIAALEGAKAAAWARITAPVARPSEALTSTRLVSAAEAACIVGVTTRWLLRQTRGLRFRRDLSRKNVRFDEDGLRRWLTTKRP